MWRPRAGVARCLVLLLLLLVGTLDSVLAETNSSEMPNIIIFALDGGILSSTWEVAYEKTIVASGTRSPNGCRVPMTWFTVGFLHGGNTGDCGIVQQAFNLGHEMATHTLSHSEKNLQYSYDQLAVEIGGQQDWLVDACGVPEEQVVGYRAPNFAINNLMGQVLADLKFGYDSSLSGEPYMAPGRMNATFNLTRCQADAEQRERCGDWDKLPLWEVPAYLLPGGFRRTDPAPVKDMSIVERMQADYQRKIASGIPVTINVHERYLQQDSSNVEAIVKFFQWAEVQPGGTWFLTYKQYKEWYEAGQPPVEEIVAGYPCDRS